MQENITCPYCKFSILNADKFCPECGVSIEELKCLEKTDVKTCSFCAKEIATAAIKCKHCGEFLDNVQKKTSQQHTSESQNNTNSTANPVNYWAFAGGVLGFVFALKYSFWAIEKHFVLPRTSYVTLLIFISYVGVCMSVIGMVQIIKLKQRGMIWAIIGIALGIWSALEQYWFFVQITEGN